MPWPKPAGRGRRTRSRLIFDVCASYQRDLLKKLSADQKNQILSECRRLTPPWSRWHTRQNRRGLRLWWGGWSPFFYGSDVSALYSAAMWKSAKRGEPQIFPLCVTLSASIGDVVSTRPQWPAKSKRATWPRHFCGRVLGPFFFSDAQKEITGKLLSLPAISPSPKSLLRLDEYIRRLRLSASIVRPRVNGVINTQIARERCPQSTSTFRA
jgi:hypothetical protein